MLSAHKRMQVTGVPVLTSRFNNMAPKILKIVREFDAVTPDGAKSRINLLLGDPYPSGFSFRCPVSIQGEPLEHKLPDIGGYDPLQSILLAIDLAKGIFSDFLEHGGKLYYRDSDKEFEIENW